MKVLVLHKDDLNGVKYAMNLVQPTDVTCSNTI